MSAATPPPEPTEAETIDLAPVHDFVRKLLQPPFHERVGAYVAWQLTQPSTRRE